MVAAGADIHQGRRGMEIMTDSMAEGGEEEGEEAHFMVPGEKFGVCRAESGGGGRGCRMDLVEEGTAEDGEGATDSDPTETHQPVLLLGYARTWLKKQQRPER